MRGITYTLAVKKAYIRLLLHYATTACIDDSAKQPSDEKDAFSSSRGFINDRNA